MQHRWLQMVAVFVAIGTAPLVPTNGSAGSCCSGASMGAAAERPARVSERVEQLLDKEGGREALVAAAMANEGFTADYMTAIAQDQRIREHAARLVREAPGGSASHKSQGQAIAYTCPMHPDVTSDRPGKCPKCRMDLVRRAAGATSRNFDRRVGRAAEKLVRDERHRDDIIDVLLADPDFTEAWSVAVGSDPRWREAALHTWTAKGAGSSARQQDRSVRSAAHYTCPMHPEVDSDRPGTCPKCGMDLVRSAS